MADGPVAADGVQIPVRSGGQRWLVSWHPPPGAGTVRRDLIEAGDPAEGSR